MTEEDLSFPTGEDLAIRTSGVIPIMAKVPADLITEKLATSSCKLVGVGGGGLSLEVPTQDYCFLTDNVYIEEHLSLEGGSYNLYAVLHNNIITMESHICCQKYLL